VKLLGDGLLTMFDAALGITEPVFTDSAVTHIAAEFSRVPRLRVEDSVAG
jgi:hypothetical protein